MSIFKPHLNYVVIGHLNSGKSTVTGHLLAKLDAIEPRELERNDQDAIELNLPSQKYAWVLDKLKSERQRGTSISATTVSFETTILRCTVTDTPGHRDYIKNTIFGIIQADIAVLVVNAVPASFQAGMARDGQTREHTLLAYALGIEQLVCVINKMDEVAFAEFRYQDVKRELSKYIRLAGFDPDQDVHKIGGIGTVPVGRVESGVLRPSMMLTFAPSGLTAEVRSVEMHHQMVAEAGPGDNIGFSVRSLAVKELQRGDVASDSSCDPALAVASFVAQVLIMNHPGTITPGYCPVMYIHTAHVACRWDAILAKIDRRTGREVERDPPSLRMGDAALVRMVPTRPLCVETYDDYPSLGRFAIRDLRTTVAVGIIKSVEKRVPMSNPVLG